MLAEKWLEAKMAGSPKSVTQHLSPAHPRYFILDDNNCFDLKEAQIRSETGRGVLGLQDHLLSKDRVYWHRDGYMPEDEDARRACEAGSEFHKWLNNLARLEVWTPENPLCAMEVIAKAYGTDDPMFAIMSE
jgi:hypothetical protein